jgi:hypothetical protein
MRVIPGYRFAHPGYAYLRGMIWRSRGTIGPSCASTLSLGEQRAQGRPDAGCTRGLVCSVESTRVSHHRFNRSDPAFPARRFTAYVRALPGVRDLIVTVACKSSSADLAPAQGRQDHTSSPSAHSITRQSMHPRPSHPAPNTRDDREAPLLEEAGRADDAGDLGPTSTRIPKIGTATEWHDGQFAHDGHAQFSPGLSGKSVLARHQELWARGTVRSGRPLDNNEISDRALMS